MIYLLEGRETDCWVKARWIGFMGLAKRRAPAGESRGSLVEGCAPRDYRGKRLWTALKFSLAFLGSLPSCRACSSSDTPAAMAR